MLAAVNDGGKCDDKNPCTPDDTCGAGVCSSKTNSCECKTDSDCAPKDDGDLCNGTLFCSQALHECVLNPVTVVTCQTVDDTQCSKALCTPKTGVCSLVAVAPKTPCDDGNPCTDGDACTDGKCLASVTAKACACEADADCAKFEDNNLCNGTLVCNKLQAQCVVEPKSIIVCPGTDNTACATNQCDGATGKCAMTSLPANTVCDDQQPCTAGDRCDGKGTCLPGNDKCECGPHKPDVDCEQSKGDGDLCNGVLWCDKTKLPFVCKTNPTSLVGCSKVDDTACLQRACVPKTGKCDLSAIPTMIGKTCEDNDPCTLESKCQQGLCAAVALKTCDDSNPCTVDSCEKASDCVNAPGSATACDDDNPCTATSQCGGGKCVGGAAISCDDGNPCTADSCDATKGAGCVHASNTAKCDDGNQCTSDDACSSGKCGGGVAKNCNDGNTCTADSCDAETGKCAVQAEHDLACALNGGAGVCAAGVCISPQTCGLLAVSALIDESTSNVFIDFLPLAEGGYVGGGGVQPAGKDATAPWVVRYDAAGKVVWSWQEPNATKVDNFVASLIDATDGGEYDDRVAEVVAVGTHINKGSQDGAIWRLGPDKTKNSVVSFGGADLDVFYAATPYKNDLVAVGATRTGSNGKGDCWIVRTDGAKLTVDWQRKVGGSGEDVCLAVAVADSLFVAAGASDSYGKDGDAFLVALDSGGKVNWKTNTGGVGVQHFNAVTLGPNGTIWAVGRDSSLAAQGLLFATDASGTKLQYRTSSVASDWLRIFGNADGTFTLFGAGKTTGGSKITSTGEVVYARTNTSGKAHQEPFTAMKVGRFSTPSFRRTPTGWAIGAAARHADSKAVHPVALVTDAWGQSSCKLSGACERSVVAGCDDADACTTDSCDAVAGCKNAAIAGCTAAADALDLDHDGLVGAADKCPTVWNPDNDPSACAALPQTKRSARLAVGEAGLPTGNSHVRRTNEPMEVPLANGYLDPSVAAWWKLDGNLDDSSGNGRHLGKGKGSPVAGVFGGDKSAMRFGETTQDNTKLAKAVVSASFTFMAWVRPRSVKFGADCTVVTSSASKVAPAPNDGSFSVRITNSGRLYASLGTHDGSYAGPGMAKGQSERLVVGNRTQWQHVAVVVRPGHPIGLYVDGLPTQSDNASVPVGPIPVQWMRIGDKSDCHVDLDDAVLFTRALPGAEIGGYVRSRRPFASAVVPTAQADFDDVWIGERVATETGARRAHFEVLGVRRHSDTALGGVVGYWPLTGSGKDVVSGGVTAKHSGAQVGAGRFGALSAGVVFDGKAASTSIVRPAVAVKDFTIEVWAAPQPGPSSKSVVWDSRGEKAENPGVSLSLEPAAKPGFAIVEATVTAGGKTHVLKTERELGTGWHHFALRRRAGTLSLFVDGLPTNETWTGSNSSTAELSLFGSQVFRLAYPAWGAAAKPYKDNAFAGTLNELLVHSVGLNDDTLAKRAIGPPRVRFLAGTTPLPGRFGYPFRQYSLHWGTAAAKAHTPKVIALDKKTACTALLSPCLGYAGWWQFGGVGPLARDLAAGRRHASLAGDARQVGGLLRHGASGYADAGSWAFPFVGSDHTLEWAGYVAALAANDGVSNLVARGDAAPAVQIAAGKWRVASSASFATGSSVSAKDSRLRAAAAVITAATKTANLYVDDEVAVKKVGFLLPTTSAAVLRIGRGKAGATLTGDTTEVRVMTRALQPDELIHQPRASLMVGATK